MSEIPNTHLNLSNQTQYRLNEINKIKMYFIKEVQEGKIMSKRLSKFIATFDYFGKTFVLPATSVGISVISFSSIIEALVGIATANFSLIFSLTTGIKKIIENKKN